MDPSMYTTEDYREELARVHRARRRNMAIVIVADIVLIIVAAFCLLGGVVS